MPRDLQDEFREQQKAWCKMSVVQMWRLGFLTFIAFDQELMHRQVLLEQKRLLEQLRHERQVAAGDQHLGPRKRQRAFADFAALVKAVAACYTVSIKVI